MSTGRASSIDPDATDRHSITSLPELHASTATIQSAQVPPSSPTPSAPDLHRSTKKPDAPIQATKDDELHAASAVSSSVLNEDDSGGSMDHLEGVIQPYDPNSRLLSSSASFMESIVCLRMSMLENGCDQLYFIGF